MVSLGIAAEEVQHALDQVRRVHPGVDQVRSMIDIVQNRLPRSATFKQAQDIVNNMWHVGVFSRLGDELADANSFFRRSGFWTQDDSLIFRGLSESLRNDRQRIPAKFAPLIDAYMGVR